MGFWNKLGKIALQAAPYVAAPFTGGASLMATGATQKLGQKWAEHDAKKAIAKGLEPSKFDKYLGLASTAAGLGSSFTGGFGLGSLGKAGSAASSAGKAASAAKTANALTGWQKNLSTAGKVGSLMMGAAPMGVGTEMAGAAGNGLGGWQGQLAGIAGGMLANSGKDEGPRSEELPSNASRGLAPSVAMPRGKYDVGAALARGRETAMMNQPFRSGYQTQVQGPEEGQIITAQNPPIYPNRRRARKRNPEPEPVEEY